MESNIDSFRASIWSTSIVITTLVMATVMGCSMAPEIMAQSKNLPELAKRTIWRIENPDGEYGTGFVLKDSAAVFVLVTNKHVVKSKRDGHYFNSVKVYRNVLTNKSKVKSTDSSFTLRLRYKGLNLYIEHDSSDVDLVLILLDKLIIGNETISNPVGIKNFHYWNTIVVADTRVTNVNDGARIQMIGYSLQFKQNSQFPSSRFGYVSNFAAENINILIGKKIRKSQWIIVDASVRGGHSGGPAFFMDEKKKKLFLVGFVQAVDSVSEITYIIPSHYILELLEKVPKLFK